MLKIGFLIAANMILATPSMACSLVRIEPEHIKKVMAKRIAQKLNWDIARVSLNAITAPVLHSPLGLGADCSGLGAFHHTAGFLLESGNCKYEGMAVVLGYNLSSPVAVHYQERCR